LKEEIMAFGDHLMVINHGVESDAAARPSAVEDSRQEGDAPFRSLL
jgi:hypothetical protein